MDVAERKQMSVQYELLKDLSVHDLGMHFAEKTKLRNATGSNGAWGKCMRETENEAWWLRKREELLEIADQNLNAYVYDLASIERAVKNMLSLESVSRVLYAVKANFNADVLRTLAHAGADRDCFLINI